MHTWIDINARIWYTRMYKCLQLCIHRAACMCTDAHIHTFIHNPFIQACTYKCIHASDKHAYTYTRDFRPHMSCIQKQLRHFDSSQVVLYQRAGVEDFKDTSGRFLWQPPLEMWYSLLISLSLISLLRDSKGKPVMSASLDRRLANSLLLCRRAIVDFFLSLNFYGCGLLFVLIDWYLNLWH